MHTDAPVGHARTLDTFSVFIVSILLCILIPQLYSAVAETGIWM